MPKIVSIWDGHEVWCRHACDCLDSLDSLGRLDRTIERPAQDTQDIPLSITESLFRRTQDTKWHLES